MEQKKKEILKISKKYAFYYQEINDFIKRNKYDKGYNNDDGSLMDIIYFTDEYGFIILSHNNDKMVLHFYYTYPNMRGKGK